MKITFENISDVIVYALEKIVSSAKKNQYIFVALCVWWLVSIIGLQQGLITYIDNFEIQANIWKREDSPTWRELKAHWRINHSRVEDIRPTGIGHIDPERKAQIQSFSIVSGDSEPNVLDAVLKDTERLIQKSNKEHRALNENNKSARLHQTWSGKVAFKPLTKKQRNQFQAIPTDTLSTYINNRVEGHTKHLYLRHKYSRNIWERRNLLVRKKYEYMGTCWSGSCWGGLRGWVLE